MQMQDLLLLLLFGVGSAVLLGAGGVWRICAHVLYAFSDIGSCGTIWTISSCPLFTSNTLYSAARVVYILFSLCAVIDTEYILFCFCAVVDTEKFLAGSKQRILFIQRGYFRGDWLERLDFIFESSQATPGACSDMCVQ